MRIQRNRGICLLPIMKNPLMAQRAMGADALDIYIYIFLLTPLPLLSVLPQPQKMKERANLASD